MTKPTIRIDVISDVMCPWCHIGKKRLENAQAELAGQVDFEVNWLPYQLDASLPKHGKDRKQYFIDKFGSLDNHARVYANIYAAGDEEGIPFKLDQITVSPNTLDAHRLIHWAGRDYGRDAQNKLVAILMRFYFEQVRHIGEDDVLVEAAELAGMNGAQIRQQLLTDEDKDTIAQQIVSFQEMGVSGVPFFILNQKYALQGAQSKQNIIEVIQDIIEKY